MIMPGAPPIPASLQGQAPQSLEQRRRFQQAPARDVFFARADRPVVPVSKAALQGHVQALTALSRDYRNINGELDQAADYIRGQWEKQGLAVEEQTFEADGRTYRNLIVSFGPEDASRLIVGAHYDAVINTPGADDNASGVAGLLELSRLLAQRRPALKNRIDLVAFTLEEPPYFRTENMGSARHARRIKAENVPVKGMIALDMIGYFSDEKNSQYFPTNLGKLWPEIREKYPVPLVLKVLLAPIKLLYPTKADFISVVGDASGFGFIRKVRQGMAAHSEIGTRSLSVPRKIVQGVDFSDHLNYINLGIPAALITDTSFYRNPHYHQPTDTPETLDFDRMTQVVQGLYGTVTGLAS